MINPNANTHPTDSPILIGLSGLVILLSLFFIGMLLKVVGILSISWLWVTLPLWGVPLVGIAVFIMLLLIALYKIVLRHYVSPKLNKPHVD